jgi:hypothetical protein
MAVKRRIGFATICVPKHPATRRPTVEAGKHSLDLTRTAMSYTLRTTHTMRAMRIIVPRIPPIYIRLSVNASERLLTHSEASLSGRWRTLVTGDALRSRPHSGARVRYRTDMSTKIVYKQKVNNGRRPTRTVIRYG